MGKDEYLLTAARARALDKKALEKFGIPTLVLMENAGREIAQAALKRLSGRLRKVAVFCGGGNNGGDGLCASRHLLTAGIQPEVYLVGKFSGLKRQAKVNLNILLRLKQKITQINPANLGLLSKRIGKSTLIIDALLGVGVKGKIRPVYQQVIDVINASGGYVISVDIPSGLEATSGKVPGRCIRADQTVTLVAKKRGMVYGEGRKYCGKVSIKSIGAPLLSF